MVVGNVVNASVMRDLNRVRALTDLLEHLVVLALQEMYRISRTDLVRSPVGRLHLAYQNQVIANRKSEP